MARKDINLLPTELREQKKTEKVKSSLGNLSLISLVIVGIISFVTSAVLINLKLTEDQLTKEAVRLEGKIKDLTIVESEASRLESKLFSIGKIIEQGNRYSILLSSVSKSSPDEITLTSLTTFGENKVSLSGTVQSYLVLSKFVTSLMDPGLGGKVFNNVDLTGASLDEVTGKIRFSMILYLKDKSLK